MVTRVGLSAGYGVSAGQELYPFTDSTAFTSFTGAGCTRATDATVTYGGASTTKLTRPAANAATNMEIGFSGATVALPGVHDEATVHELIFKTNDNSVTTTPIVYIGDAAFANFGIRNSEPSTLQNCVVDKDGWTHAFFKSVWSKTGTPVFYGTVRSKVRVTFSATSAAETSVWIAQLRAVPKARAKIVFTVDDGYDEWYTYLYPAALARKIPVSMGISYGYSDTAGFLTSAQIQEIANHSSGLFEMTNHGRLNDNYLVQGLSAYLSDLVNCRKFLVSLGLSYRAASLHQYVQGEFDAALIKALKSNGFLSCRTTQKAYRYIHSAVCARGYPTSDLENDEYSMPMCGNLDSGTSLATMKTYIEAAIKVGGTFFLMGHQFHPTTAGALTWTEGDTNSLMDWMNQKKAQGLVDIVKWSDWHAGLTRPRGQ